MQENLLTRPEIEKKCAMKAKVMNKHWSTFYYKLLAFENDWSWKIFRLKWIRAHFLN